MTSQQLSERRLSRPLTDSDLVSDILELCVDEASRTAGTLFMLLCDDSGRLVQPLAVDDLPANRDEAVCESVLDRLIGLAKRINPGVSVLVATVRPGECLPDDDDQMWVTAARQVCSRAGVRLLGVHPVTTEGTLRLWSEDAVA